MHLCCSLRDGAPRYFVRRLTGCRLLVGIASSIDAARRLKRRRGQLNSATTQLELQPNNRVILSTSRRRFMTGWVSVSAFSGKQEPVSRCRSLPDGPLAGLSTQPGPHRTRQRCSGSVCDRRSASRPVPSRQNRLQARLEAVLTGRNGSGRARTVANRAGTALTGAVRTGCKQPGSTDGRRTPVTLLGATSWLMLIQNRSTT